MKETNVFMSLLIPDPRSHGKEINVYLQPLIEELKEIDFWGWSTKGYQACPTCMGDRSSFRIRGRISFMGHGCYLPKNYVWCRSRLDDGKVERRAPIVGMNGHEILEQLDQLEFSVMRLTLIPQSLKDRLCVMSLDFIDYVDEHLSHASETSDDDELYTMSSFPRTNFLETDAMFLKFADDLDNLLGGRRSFSQPSVTSTPRRRVQSRLLELERYFTANRWIPMMIAPGREYIKVVKGDLLCVAVFMLDFNDQTMNRFVEHQMLNTFKKFQDDYHRHFKKYSTPRRLMLTHPPIGGT
ncbi:gamma-aminobutyrate transaminase POP2 [Cucumis melo var. makuwa]|uniref:Gamma-aminobutyrate transaminase POP2 n=1 Tax=Cucumis melo var. makuwa TaxID=1194695 RepID=A0A5A7UZC7_CUCMM|nr:gamma-aminobutyrate transaminase POP2 [Cucumis melo var. makuwa]TYK14269.1 gamma-aminobutyrate transaminase POP2 [Cucumis melo var. makuwa]